MYRLQVILVPPSLKDGIPFNLNSTLEESSHLLNNDNIQQQTQQISNTNMSNNSILLSSFMTPQKMKRFLIFTKPANTLLELSEEILSKCEKMYPSLSEEIEITSLQDHNSCDLDPDFIVKDVFNLDNTVRVILKNDIDFENTEPISLYTKKRKLNNGTTQPQSNSMKKVRNQTGNTTVIRNTATNLRISTPLANQIYPSAALSNNSDDEDADKSFLPPPTQPQSPPIRISSGITDSKKVKYSNMDDSVSRSETVDPDKSKQQRILSGTPLRSTATPNRVMLTGQRVVSENKNTSTNNGLIFTSNQSAQTQPASARRHSSSRITSGMLTIPEPKIAEVEIELGEGPSSPSSILPAKSDRIPMKKPYIENNDSSSSESEIHTFENNENTIDKLSSKSSPFNNVPSHSDRKSSLEAKLEKKTFAKRGVRRMNGFSEEDDHELKKKTRIDINIPNMTENSSDIETEANNTVKFTDLHSDGHDPILKKDLLNILDDSSTNNVKNIILKETENAVLEKSTDMVIEDKNIVDSVKEDILESPTKKPEVKDSSINHQSLVVSVPGPIVEKETDVASTASESETETDNESPQNETIPETQNLSKSRLIVKEAVKKSVKTNNKSTSNTVDKKKSNEGKIATKTLVKSVQKGVTKKQPIKPDEIPTSTKNKSKSPMKKLSSNNYTSTATDMSELPSSQPTAYIEAHIKKPTKAIDTYNPDGKIKISRYEDVSETDISSEDNSSGEDKNVHDRTLKINEYDFETSKKEKSPVLADNNEDVNKDINSDSSSSSSSGSDKEYIKTDETMDKPSTESRSIRLTSESIPSTKKSRKIYQTPEFIETTDDEISSDTPAESKSRKNEKFKTKVSKSPVVQKDTEKEEIEKTKNAIQSSVTSQGTKPEDANKQDDTKVPSLSQKPVEKKKIPTKNSLLSNSKNASSASVENSTPDRDGTPKKAFEKKISFNDSFKTDTKHITNNSEIKKDISTKKATVRPSLAPKIDDKNSNKSEYSSSESSTDGSSDSDSDSTNSDSDSSSSDEEASSSSRGKRMVVAPPKGELINNQKKRERILTDKSLGDISDVPQSTQTKTTILSDKTIKNIPSRDRASSASSKHKATLPSSQPQIVLDPKSITPMSSQNGNAGIPKTSPISKLPQKFRPSLSSLSDLVSRGIPDVKDKTNQNSTPSLAGRSKDILNKTKKDESSSSDSSSGSDSSSENSSTDSDPSSSDSSDDDKESYISAKSAKATLKKKKRPSGGFASLIKDSKKKK